MGIAIFNYWFNQASGEEAKVLSVIASSEIPVSVKEIREMAKADKVEVSPQNVPKYLQRLVEKNLLSKIGRGLYIIPDQMFRVYILTRPD